MNDRRQSVTDYYRQESHAQTYDDVRFGNAGGRFVNTWEKAILMRLIHGHPIVEPILEVAAGTGRFSLMLARMGYRVVAVDSSMEMLKMIMIIARREGLSIQCVHADAFNLPFSTNTFHTVFSIRFVWHFRNFGDLISELARASKETIIFDVIDRFSLAALTAPIANQIVHRSLYTGLTSRSVIQEVFDASGLTKITQEAAFLFPYIFYRKLSFLTSILGIIDKFTLGVLPLGSVQYYKAKKLDI